MRRACRALFTLIRNCRWRSMASMDGRTRCSQSALRIDQEHACGDHMFARRQTAQHFDAIADACTQADRPGLQLPLIGVNENVLCSARIDDAVAGDCESLARSGGKADLSVHAWPQRS